MTKLAFIDCGTNTFHLLVAEATGPGQFKTLWRQQIFVYLAEDGIGRIGEKPYERGMNALRAFRASLDEQGVERVKAVGTAALRTAANGPDFLAQALHETRIPIELITGDEEAQLICDGVRLAVPMQGKTMLIMDIGGGSVEYILTDDTTIFWAQSFPVGVAVLYNNFHKSEPIAPNEVAEMSAFLENALQPLVAAVAQFPPEALIGAAGAFDILEDMLVPRADGALYNDLPMDGVKTVHDMLLAATYEERLAMKGIPTPRARLVVAAMILIDVSLRITGSTRLIFSDYALKQGGIFRMSYEEM